MKAPSTSPVSFRPFALPVASLLLLGWGGLIFVILAIPPTVWGRWFFYAFWVLALTGTAMPVTFIIHRSAIPADPTLENAIVRQALGVGVYGALLAWLQLSRLNSLWTVVGLAFGLMVIEALIRLREKSRWRPPYISEAPPSNASDEELP